MVLHREV
jgi:hypothetical protein